LVSDARSYYEHQQSIGTVWGVVLPSWDSLSWEDQIAWEERYVEQMTRDKEDATPDGHRSH
jgi:hypothetical protein